MKTLSQLFFCGAIFAGLSLATAQESEEVFEYDATEVNYLTGEGVNVGGFIYPTLYVIGTGGWLENGANATDLANTDHDPQNDIGIQQLELSLDLNFNDVVTGLVTGTGTQGADEWEARLEEAYLHYHVNDNIKIGGGQFFNTIGWQNKRHLHSWDYVNQNISNTRFLNEGELITQGGEIIINVPNEDMVITIGGGGVVTHAHEHEEEEHGEEEEGEHVEADGANFDDYVVSADVKYSFPGDDSLTLNAGLAFGENGFNDTTYVYSLGAQKIWNGHDHGGGTEFAEGAFMVRTEWIGRDVNGLAEHEEHEEEEEEGEDHEEEAPTVVNIFDHGLSTSLHYGLSNVSTLSFRHDWAKGTELFETSDIHRFSPALTTHLGANNRIKARVQYDYIQSDALQTEHAAWLQFTWQWGGDVGCHECDH